MCYHILAVRTDRTTVVLTTTVTSPTPKATRLLCIHNMVQMHSNNNNNNLPTSR